jgi:hypothetical protein
MGFTSVYFYIEPFSEAVFRSPYARHLGATVSFYHFLAFLYCLKMFLKQTGFQL